MLPGHKTFLLSHFFVELVAVKKQHRSIIAELFEIPLCSLATAQNKSGRYQQQNCRHNSFAHNNTFS